MRTITFMIYNSTVKIQYLQVQIITKQLRCTFVYQQIKFFTRESSTSSRIGQEDLVVFNCLCCRSSKSLQEATFNSIQPLSLPILKTKTKNQTLTKASLMLKLLNQIFQCVRKCTYTFCGSTECAVVAVKIKKA